jgi:hypothetical protein
MYHDKIMLLIVDNEITKLTRLKQIETDLRRKIYILNILYLAG